MLPLQEEEVKERGRVGSSRASFTPVLDKHLFLLEMGVLVRVSPRFLDGFPDRHHFLASRRSEGRGGGG